ncbi:hypothetical protein M231_06369, partial [Tremella mesenterica]
RKSQETSAAEEAAQREAEALDEKTEVLTHECLQLTESNKSLQQTVDKLRKEESELGKQEAALFGPYVIACQVAQQPISPILPQVGEYRDCSTQTEEATPVPQPIFLVNGVPMF